MSPGARPDKIQKRWQTITSSRHTTYNSWCSTYCHGASWRDACEGLS
jgi:hypothetical protein